jgi:2'-5' RNA ligase
MCTLTCPFPRVVFRRCAQLNACVPRVRLAVAVLVPQPVAAEVDGLRRACGDTMLDRVPAHLTLVPPVNVRVDDVPLALSTLRTAAATAPPEFELSIGPPTTFHPATPVVYLDVAPVGELVALREALWVVPLARPQTRPFVPHVTLADEAPEARIPAMVEGLADYRASIAVDAITMLQEGEGRVWTPIADARLGRPMVVGRGGLPVELTLSTMPDPEVLAAFDMERADLCVTARRDGGVLGAATARADGDIVDVQVADGELEDIERHLRKAIAAR